jgi:hypothetical protein
MMLFEYKVTFIFFNFAFSEKGGKDSLDGAIIRQRIEAAR